MADKSCQIEGEFRDGSYRLRGEEGKYYSVSNAILAEISEFEWFTEGDLAKRLGIERQIVLEHLGYLREHGVIEGDNGSWTRDAEFHENESSEYLRQRNEQLPPWERRNADDESIY